jgi:hypothetical protein
MCLLQRRSLRLINQKQESTMAQLTRLAFATMAPARADAMVQMMTMHLDGMKSMATAGKALYAVMNDAQKKMADEMMSGQMGRM